MLMMTGIMAMFEMATSFNSQQFQFRPPPDAYSGTDAQRADRDLLRLFSDKHLWTSMVDNNKPWAGDSLCDQLICKFNQNASDKCSQSNQYNSHLFGRRNPSDVAISGLFNSESMAFSSIDISPITPSMFLSSGI